MTRLNLLNVTDAVTLLAPTHIDRSAFAKGRAVSGSPTWAANTAAFRGGHRSMTNIGDYVEYEEVMAAGTWAIDLETLNPSSGGSFIVTVDGVSVGTIDTYAASTVATRTEITGIVVATSGKHLIRLTVTTKNASSSATTCRISGYTLTRTA